MRWIFFLLLLYACVNPAGDPPQVEMRAVTLVDIRPAWRLEHSVNVEGAWLVWKDQSTNTTYEQFDALPTTHKVGEVTTILMRR